MANPTTNFGWVMPTNTDLVTDLPADFAVFGQGVDTTMADLKGGTTGQVLSKATSTDMDFTWITNSGDISSVAVTSPLTGGGTTGAVTVGIQDASTAQKGSVQLSDSTSTTSSILASTPTATKAAYDLAAAAIPKSTVTTAGDVIYATGASAVTRLGVGSAGQVLTVAAGVPSWATPASTKTITQIASGTLSGASVTISTLSSYDDLYLRIWFVTSSVANLYVRLNASSATNYYWDGNTGTTAAFNQINQAGATEFSTYDTLRSTGSANAFDYRFTNCKNAGFTNVQMNHGYANGGAVQRFENTQGVYTSAAAVSSIVMSLSTGTFSGGNYTLWGG